MTDDGRLLEIFDLNSTWFPDLFEPYVYRMAEARDDDERRAIMWAGLRETIRRRYPAPGLDMEIDRQLKLGST